jgi:hypothetical protein
MKFNTDSSFIGLDKLKRTHSDQIVKFEEWALRDDWEMFHHSHYDWWVFPVNRRSSYGLMWTVYEGEIVELKKDSVFLEKYLRGVQLVSASWSWDVFQAIYILDPKPGQSWHHWPVRLYKAAQSVKLFGYEDLFASLKRYAHDLMRQSEPMTYGGKDLSWLFTTGIDPYKTNR